MAGLRSLAFLFLAAAAQAIRISDSLTVANPCDGCELTVDLKCDGLRPRRGKRSAPYHRIQDCIMPMYGLIDLARNASKVNNTKVCAVTWLDPWEGLGLQPYLRNISGVKWHSIINEREQCAHGLRYHTINRTKQFFASDEWLKTLGKDKNMIHAHPIDVMSNLRGIQADAKRYVGAEGGWSDIVLISRLTGARMFRPVASEGLVQSLERHTHRKVTHYFGNETFVATLRMFNQAAGVIGYHGAAWANTYFTAQSHCNVQVSTFVDLESNTKWRISHELLFNDKGVWTFYRLPLKLLLETNHVPLAAYARREEKDHFIKDLPWVPLRTVDIAELTSHMSVCLADPPAFAASHRAPENATHTRGWNSRDSALPSGLAAAGVVPEPRDPCSLCDFTVDLRCDGADRRSYHSVVMQCLFPAYEMFQLAREVGSNESARVCAITWNKAEHTLHPFLTEFVGVPWYKIINEDHKCVNHLRYHIANSTEEWGASRRDQRSGADDRMVRSYPIDKKWNLKWMQNDAANIAGKPNPRIILIQNQKHNMFPGATLEALRARLNGVGLLVTLFTGAENIVDTAKIFTNTGGIVGYHGPAWTNGILTAMPHCAFQYSTYEDFAKKKKWKTTEDIMKLQTNVGDYRFHHVPLKSILDGNNITRKVFNASARKTNFLDTLSWVPLTDDEVHESAIHMRLCWQSKWVGYRRQLMAYDQSGNNRDHGY